MRMTATIFALCLVALAGCKQADNYSETPTALLCMDYLDEWGTINFNHDSRIKALIDRVGDPKKECNKS